MLQKNIPLSKFTTFGIGGPAKFFAEVEKIEQVSPLFRFCQEEKCPFLILGKGSNTLFDDRGFPGLVILNKLTDFREISPTRFYVESGFSFSLLGAKTARMGLSGLEFASGIPGSVGGAIFMNAGANGKETAETVVSVDFMEEDGSITHYTKEDLSFSYRHSPFHHKKGMVLAATFQLKEEKGAREKQIEIINRRKATQPLQEMSAGCIFRNPRLSPAGQLIELCGLKGHRIGGATVSPIHANFIVNSGGATAQNVLDLIQLVQERVKEGAGEELQMEIRYIPYDS